MNIWLLFHVDLLSIFRVLAKNGLLKNKTTGVIDYYGLNN